MPPLASPPVAAQVQRSFPQNALRGAHRRRHGAGDRRQRPAGAARARLRASATATTWRSCRRRAHGGKFLVHYTVDTCGLVKDVWILTPRGSARTSPGRRTAGGSAGLGVRSDRAGLGQAVTKVASAKPKVFIKTFGCQMNVYDSDKMADVLHAAAGYEPTDDVEQADLILFNTCSVREKAQEKVFSDLGRVKHLKDKGALIGVGGCVASQEGAAIVKRAPYVDLVFGPQTLHRLPAMLARRSERAAAAGRHQLSRDREVRPPAAGAGRGRRPPSSRSWKAAPSTAPTASFPTPAAKRCRARSTTCSPRSPAWPTRACARSPCSARTSTPTAARWAARPRSPTSRRCSRSSPRFPGIERIRYTTSHPKEFTQRLIDAYGRVPKLVDHLHLPVQHGSDRILAAMKRGYTALEYKSTVRKLRARAARHLDLQRLHRRLSRARPATTSSGRWR